MSAAILNPKERALLTDLQDRMIEQLVRRDEARSRNDHAVVTEAQTEINRLTAECDLLRRAATSH